MTGEYKIYTMSVLKREIYFHWILSVIISY